jgi:lysyl-tRNA synthetase class 2
MVAPAALGEAADVYAPHALAGNPALLERRLCVGGRLLHSEQGLQIADAFAALPVDPGELPTPLAMLPPGSLVVARGRWNGAALVDVEWLELESSTARTLPPEFERLRAGVGRRLQLRARVLGEIRRFFQERDFLEVDTPIRARECAIEPHIEALRSGERYLITSPELHMKRLLVAGIPQLFQLVHCFRADELGPLHAPEFLMLEWYRAFAGWQQLLEDTERLLAHLAERVLGGSELHLPSGPRIDLRPPFLRLSVREAFARFAGVSDAAELAARDEDAFFQLLVDRVEPGLASYSQPVFLCDYPSSQAALARRSPEDPSVAERFELYVGGIELCNGFGELNDPVEQRRRSELDRERCRALGRHVPDLPERFLRALEQGMPRASGNALGVDRLVMLLAGESSIEAVRPFASEGV